MTAYVIRRILIGLLILVLVTMLVFLLVRLLPGDPVMRYMAAFVGTSTGQQNIMTPEQHDEMMKKLGLDRPIPVQYWDWISHVVRGDLGTSLVIQTPINKLISDVLPRTAYIGSLMFIVGTVGGILVGIYCALRRGSWLDNTLTTIANIGMTIPVFWLGILLIYLFAYKLNWFPMYGWVAPWDNFWKSCTYVILPVASVALGGIAGMARLTRSCMLEVMGTDYVRTAWSKGLRERVIVFRHQLKNAMIPVVTALGGTLGMILGGSVFIETVFSIPGMGRLMTQAIFDYDYQIVQASALIFGAIIIFSNLVVDLAWGWLDPRIRYS
jgi:peptide/nickel transport system permease protein